MSEALTVVPAPDLENPLFAPYWEGTRQGKLMVQECVDCGTKRWPPREMCWSCGSLDASWTEVAQQGELYSWTIVGHRTAKGYADVPYAVGIVEIQSDPVIRMIGGVVDVEASTLAAGLKLKAKFTPAGTDGEMVLVQWEPAP